MNICFEGYTEKNLGDVYFYECPNCNKHVESLTGRGKDIWECDSCKHQDILENFSRVLIKKQFLTCKKCQTKISVTPSNAMGSFYLCFNCRENIVGVEYNEEFYQPSEIMNLGFQHPEKIKRIGKESYLIECRNIRTNLTLQMLQFLSQEENDGFLSFQPDYQRAMLLYVQDQCIGYLIWSLEKNKFNGSPILRQIFIQNEHRRNGYGSLLLQKWFEFYVKSKGKKFGIENPKPFTMKILISQNHIIKKENRLEYVDCFFIQ